jgi:hypothetical protein
MRLAGMLLGFLPLVGFRMMPVEWRASLVQSFTMFGTKNALLLAALVVVLLDAGLLVGAMARFRRARLILD